MTTAAKRTSTKAPVAQPQLGGKQQLAAYGAALLPRRRLVTHRDRAAVPLDHVEERVPRAVPWVLPAGKYAELCGPARHEDGIAGADLQAPGCLRLGQQEVLEAELDDDVAGVAAQRIAPAVCDVRAASSSQQDGGAAAVAQVEELLEEVAHTRRARRV